MLAGFYLMWLAFTAIFVACLVVIFSCARKKQLYTVNAFMTAVLALFSFIIVAVCSYDFYAKLTDDHVAAGQCEFTYVRGGKSMDTTEIVIDEQLYKIKSEFFKTLDDGVYSCEIRYLPLTKIVYQLAIH